MKRVLAIGALLAAVTACAGNPSPRPASAVALTHTATDSETPAVRRCRENGGTYCTVPPADVLRRDSAARYAHGGIALHSAGVDDFAAQHPDWDGRGVLIAILDSGIDPVVDGLATTSTNATKVLDVRDFSAEGRVVLRRTVRRGDTVVIGPRRLAGATHVAAFAADSNWWGGLLIETPLGKKPAADLNGNGSNSDSLPVLVARTPEGWAAFVDQEGAGTLASAQPLRDYTAAHQTFVWLRRDRRGELQPPSVNIAVNLRDSSGVPLLDFAFDNGEHGTHVAGIAAGHDLYGVHGFDGVAPGAFVISAKIANDAHGGISVTAGMERALKYVIEFARARDLPLVVNLSFGVGNEIEGRARIDHIIDSVLAAHPEVVMTIAAGNDGPGLSTVGFPGSASRVISVGATMPAAFAGEAGAHEAVAFFSSRGGELASPDLVVPGAAYSTVPRYAAGDEIQTGTSMAAPYAAGLAARLMSALRARGTTASAAMIRQALMVSARTFTGASIADQGAGIPQLQAAWDWLQRTHDLPAIRVEANGIVGRPAVMLTLGDQGARVTGARVTVKRLDSDAPIALRLHADALWIDVPESISLLNGQGEFTVRVNTASMPSSGFSAGAVRIEGPDETAGPLAVVPVTVRAISRLGADVAVSAPPSGIGRTFFRVDSGRSVQFAVGTAQTAMHATASLHEPGGMPFRDGAMIQAGSGVGLGTFDVEANDAVAGIYEVDLIAPPTSAVTGHVTARAAPVRLSAMFARDTLRVLARNVTNVTVPIRLRAGLVGAQRDSTVVRRGSDPVRIALALPKWASHIIVDGRMAQAQWNRFTDFGVTFLDRFGHVLGVSPVNYAVSRASFDVPDSLPTDTVVVQLDPGLAQASDQAEWVVDLSIKLMVEKPYALDDGGSAMRPVAAGASREERFAQTALPIDLPRGFVPLITLVALEGDDWVWTSELAIPWKSAP